MAKQILIDIMVVLAVPIIVIGAYYFWKTDDGAFLSLLSSDLVLPGDEGKELGTKTKLVLSTLDSIRFDRNFFTDEAYLSLRDLTATVATTTLGREYPFTQPADIIKKLKTAKPAAVSNSAPTGNISVKIDSIKGAATKKP